MMEKSSEVGKFNEPLEEVEEGIYEVTEEVAETHEEASEILEQIKEQKEKLEEIAKKHTEAAEKLRPKVGDHANELTHASHHADKASKAVREIANTHHAAGGDAASHADKSPALIHLLHLDRMKDALANSWKAFEAAAGGWMAEHSPQLLKFFELIGHVFSNIDVFGIKLLIGLIMSGILSDAVMGAYQYYKDVKAGKKELNIFEAFGAFDPLPSGSMHNYHMGTEKQQKRVEFLMTTIGPTFIGVFMPFLGIAYLLVDTMVRIISWSHGGMYSQGIMWNIRHQTGKLLDSKWFADTEGVRKTLENERSVNEMKEKTGVGMMFPTEKWDITGDQFGIVPPPEGGDARPSAKRISELGAGFGPAMRGPAQPLAPGEKSGARSNSASGGVPSSKPASGGVLTGIVNNNNGIVSM